jgi:hypothetical protein
MALQKQIELKSGVVTNYHRIKSITKSKDVSRGVESIVTIDHFVSDDTSKEPVTNSSEFIAEVYSFTDAYNFIKQLPKYDGAIDLL